MYKEEVYHSIAREFSTGIGVATAYRVTEVAGDPHVERSREDRIRYRAVQDEWRVNRIIGDAVKSDKYRELTRRVFRLRLSHPDWSTRRWYTTAWGDIVGRKTRKVSVKTNKTNKTRIG